MRKRGISPSIVEPFSFQIPLVSGCEFAGASSEPLQTCQFVGVRPTFGQELGFTLLINEIIIVVLLVTLSSLISAMSYEQQEDQCIVLIAECTIAGVTPGIRISE